MKMKPAWPEDASILSRWTYIYMIPLLVKGANKKGIVIYEEEDGVKKERIVEGPGLTPDDLYELPNKMKSENVIEAFEKAFEVSGKNVLKAIWKMGAKDYFIPAAICEFVRIVALSVSTLLLKEVLQADRQTDRQTDNKVSMNKMEKKREEEDSVSKGNILGITFYRLV